MRLDHVLTEVEPHKFATEASTLGWTSFPQNVATSLGNGLGLYLARIEKHEGEVICAKYEQPCGCITVTVFND